jgi:hypothetical protein
MDNLRCLILAGWINRHQQDVIEYLKTENRVLGEKLGTKRILLNEGRRRRLAVKGKTLGRKLLQGLGTIVTPDTILRWHRELVAQKRDYGGRCRRVGRPPAPQEIVELLLRMAAKIRVGVLMSIGESPSIQTTSDVYEHRFQPDNDDQRRFRSCETLMVTLEQHSFFTPSRLRPGVFKAAAKTQNTRG